MARRTHYYMLMASLPPLPAVFTRDQTPISRLRLNRRLEMLEPEDQAELNRIERLMWWDRMPLGTTDDEILDRAADVIPRIRSTTLREVASWRLELRTVVAALRRRALGQPAPAPDHRWGYGRWVRRIAASWTLPDFGLGGILPWVQEFARLLDAGDSLGFERELLGVSWRTMSRAAEGHWFSFEAVALYVLRWDVIARWTDYDGARAAARFDALVREGLGDHASLFAAGHGAEEVRSA